jgi:hypothetical protein
MTATPAELNYLDITTLGTGAASKAVVLDANGDYIFPAGSAVGIDFATNSAIVLLGAGDWQVGGVAVTSTAAELNYLDKAAAVGVVEASKALVADATGKIDFAAAFGGTAAANSLVMGGGTSGDPLTTATASKSFIEFRTESTATTGDSRALYLRHSLNGAGISGEAIRAFSKVEAAAATVRGAHISIDFASGGSVSGFGAGLDAQVLYADAVTNAGTLTAINLEMFAGGATTDVSGLNSFIRCVFNGTQAGIDNFDDDAVLFSLVGLTAGAGHLFDSTANLTNAQIDHSLKISIGGTLYYIPLMDNADGS